MDQHYFYRLRTEQYGPKGELIYLEDRIAALYNPDLQERGYHNLISVWWTKAEARLSLVFSVHDGHRHQQWTGRISRSTLTLILCDGYGSRSR